MHNLEHNPMEISNYDEENYDYREYWNGRQYEDKAEKIALKKLLKGTSGKRYIDIGGSFGRNAELVADTFKEVVILDYSLNTLLKYEKEILEKYPNVKLIAANAYKLPFVKNSFDGGMSIRVLHHLNTPELYFTQLGRIFASGAHYIQEVANKVHLKASLKWILSGRAEMLDESPYQQPTRKSKEKEGSTTEGVFMNFHPTHIKKEMHKNGFMRLKTRSCSFLRIPSLKRILPISALLFFERVAQFLLGGTYIAPSILLRGIMIKSPLTLKNQSAEKNLDKSFVEILRCPECLGKLEINGDTATCTKCSKQYTKHSTVWDLRA